MSTMSRSLRILLVEDHADTQLFMSRLLGALQHDVQVAGTLKHARQLAGTCAFDVVISDLGLPDGDGLALIRELKEKHGLKGIALSGAGDELDLTQQTGLFAKLLKPIDFDKLQEVLARVA